MDKHYGLNSPPPSLTVWVETGFRCPRQPVYLSDFQAPNPHPAVPPRWHQYSAAYTRIPLRSTYYISCHCRKVAQATWNTPDSYHFSFRWLAKVPPAQSALECAHACLSSRHSARAPQDPPACTMSQIQSRDPTGHPPCGEPQDILVCTHFTTRAPPQSTLGTQPTQATAPAKVTRPTQSTQGMTIHKTIPSSFEVAVLPNSWKQIQQVKQYEETKEQV